MRHFFTDTTTATLQVVGDSVRGDASAEDADTVQLDSPWNDFFDTDEYVRFRATVAQDIVQPYFYDGEVQYFAKDETELREAQAQIQHLPWTMGHPDDDRVTDSSEIRGFWDSPEYDDGQHAEVYIPADDTAAVRFAIQNDEVSVGFSGVLDWIEEPDKDTPSLTTDDTTVYADAVQRNMAYDHIASVENGRCPPEEGCGLHTDEAHDTPSLDTHGHVVTNVTDKTEAREERAEYRYETKESARDAASELDCADVADDEDPIHSYDTPDGTVYIPCKSHGEFRRAFHEERGDEFRYDSLTDDRVVALADDIGESQTEAIKTIREEHNEMDGAEISPNLSTLKEVYERGAAAWEDSHAPGANQQQWALARVREFLKDLRNGNALNSGADNDLAPDGYSPPSGSQEAGDSTPTTDAVRTTRTEEDGVVYQHDESYPYDDDSHRYDSRDAAREAAADVGCEGAHKHEGPDGDVWYMPCGSMDTFDRVTDSEHSYMDACGCPHVTTDADRGRTCSDGPCRCGLHTVGDAEINGTTVDLTVPDGAQAAAEAFLQAKEDGVVGSDCGTGVGTTSAEMIAEGEVTADRLTSKIHPYLQRADQYITRDTHPTEWPDEAWQDCGDAQYAAWGWTDLRDWAEDTVEEIEDALAGDTTDAVTAALSVSDYETWVASDDSIEGVISYDGLSDGQLDESAIPNDDYEDHYVFAADTKSESSYPLVDADRNLRRGNVGAAWEVYGHADDETLLLSVLAQANERFANADGYSAPIDAESLEKAMTESQTASDHVIATDSTERISNPLTTFMTDSDNGGDGGIPSDPTEFYDGEPSVEQLADDFGTVQMLLDEKKDLESEVNSLTDELREHKRDEAEQKAAELTEMTEFWGDEDTLLEQFEDGELSLTDLDEKIEAAESIRTTETTTGGDDGDSTNDSTFVADRAQESSDREYDRTSKGKIDLSSH